MNVLDWRALRAIIVDTFQEAFARWLFWGLFGLSTLLILFFLFVLKIDIVQGAVTMGGLQNTGRPIYDMQKFVRVSYSWVATFLYIWGTFLAVFASSGLIPSTLEPGRISLLLAKPITRPMLLAGRFIGNLLIITLNSIYLIGAIWLIIGMKTNIWDGRFLIAIPISVFLFAVLLCVVVLIGVLSESAALSVMVPVALMLVTTILAQRDFVIRLLSSEWSRTLWQALYWVLPKVYDLGLAMRQAILRTGDAYFAAPIWTSAAFGAVALAVAVQLFRKRDY